MSNPEATIKHVTFRNKPCAIKVEHLELFSKVTVVCGKPKRKAYTSCERKNTVNKAKDLLKRVTMW